MMFLLLKHSPQKPYIAPKVRQTAAMETKNMDEKDALKIVKWWVESQLKVKKAFRESLFTALEKLYFYTKVKKDAASLYDYGPPTNILQNRLTTFWHKAFLLFFFFFFFFFFLIKR